LSESAGSMSELQTLIQGTKENVEISGYDMVPDDEGWQWVMIFPMMVLKDNGEPEAMPNKKAWNDAMDDPKAAAKKLFKDRVWASTGFQEKFKPGMTNLQFHETVREELAQLLASVRCGFRMEAEVSVDKDEKLLKIAMTNPDTQKKNCGQAGDPYASEA